MAPHADVKPGFDALRRLVIRALDDAARATSTLAPLPALTPALHSAATPGASPSRLLALLMATVSDDSLHADIDGPAGPAGPATPGGAYDDSALATSSEESATDRQRLIALVELARKGDVEAFGLLYDHYQGSVYRFLFHRTRSATLAEDLTSETFFRALRSMQGFRWQGKDFGAWLMTIARNLATDHFKAGRTRLEMTTEDMGQHDDATEGGPDQRDPAQGPDRAARRAARLPGDALPAGDEHRRDRGGARPQRRGHQAAAAARRAQPRQADAGRPAMSPMTPASQAVTNPRDRSLSRVSSRRADVSHRSGDHREGTHR